MSWYLAKLVYRIHCGNLTTQTQFEEQLRLIEAEDALHAFNKAQLIGQREQGEVGEGLVQWHFLDVTELHRLMPDTHGAEVYSQIREVQNARDYQQEVHTKARYLLSNSTDDFLHTLTAHG
ncbi:MAG: DUF4288 domain-containing protein [Chitinophagaceae bacterium]|jgi:hypothetical protein|nr:DUF4288 domain-containing protein [Chitinophagaceae bacterium]